MKTNVLTNGWSPVQDQKLNENGNSPSRNETLKAGTLFANYPGTYRTEDGGSYYKFRFVELYGGKFEIDILDQPSYRGRDEGYTVAHRLPSARGGLKICVTAGREPASLHEAHKLAMGWAELTNTYIKSGTTIDTQIERNARR